MNRRDQAAQEEPLQEEMKRYVDAKAELQQKPSPARRRELHAAMAEAAGKIAELGQDQDYWHKLRDEHLALAKASRSGP